MSDLESMHFRAARGLVWAVLTQVVGRGATVVSTLVLARLLVPGDFGLFAVGILVINYLDRVKDVGVGAALVYRKEEWSRLAGTGLPLSIASAAVLAILAYLSAPLAAVFFQDPRVVELVRVLAVALFVSGFSVVPESRLRRELDFRRRLVPETAASVVKGAVAIGLAVVGYGVWSLVWGQLAGTIILSLLYWLLSGWRPTFGWHAEDARRLLRYGVPSACVAVFAVVLDNLDYLIIGRRMNAEQLGNYVLAYRLPELTIIGFCIVAGQVLFPLFSRLQEDLPALRRSYLEAACYVSLITVPASVLLALLAEDAVLALYSDQWRAAIPALRLLALFAAVYSLNFHAGEIYKATGRPGILNTLACGRLLLLAPALWFAAGHSITAVAAVILLANVGITVVELGVVCRILRLPAVELLAAFRPAMVGTAGMTAAVLAVSRLMWNAPSGIRLVLLTLVGVGAFALVVQVTDPALMLRVRDRLRRLVRPPAPARGGRPA